MQPRWIRVAAMIVGLALVLACGGPQPDDPPAADGPTDAPVGIELTGTVELAGRDQHGDIQVYIPATAHVSITDSTGQFLLAGVQPGRHEVRARAEGYAPAGFEAIDVGPEDRGTRIMLGVLELEPRSRVGEAQPAASASGGQPGVVQGAVRLAAPAAASIVDVDWTECIVELTDTPYRTVCDPDGRFMIWSVPPGNYQLEARLRGFEPATQPVRVLPGPEADPINLVLNPIDNFANRRIDGFVRMLDGDGQPTNGFDQVVVEVVGRPGLSTTLDAEGAFSLTSLTPGTYILTARAPGYAPAPPMSIDLTELESIEAQLTLTADGSEEAGGKGTVTGLALKNEDDPLEMNGITVGLSGTSLMALTNDLGRYTIAGVPPGTYRVVAQADGYDMAMTEPFELATGQTVELEPLLLEPQVDAPRVIEASPADGARVTIQREIPLTIRFSKKMQPESLRGAIGITPEVDFRVFAGRDRPDTDFDLIKVVLLGAEAARPARFETEYRLSISTAARDFDNNALEEAFEMSVQTGSPEVIGTLPADGGMLENNSPGHPVAIYFNARMDHSTLSSDVLRIRPRLMVEPIVSLRDDPATGWTRMYIAADWEADTEYTIRVERRARTSGRDSLANTPYNFSFETPALREAVMPEPLRPARR